ncbi:hypothetical protein CR513_35417, partial [Mucuna pruriens]
VRGNSCQVIPPQKNKKIPITHHAPKIENYKKEPISRSMHLVRVTVFRHEFLKEGIPNEESAEFLKFISHSEYELTDQLKQTPANISLFSLLMNSESHRKLLIKVLNKAYVDRNISVDKFGAIVGNIKVNNYLAFFDDRGLDPSKPKTESDSQHSRPTLNLELQLSEVIDMYSQRGLVEGNLKAWTNSCEPFKSLRGRYRRKRLSYSHSFHTSTFQSSFAYVPGRLCPKLAELIL